MGRIKKAAGPKHEATIVSAPLLCPYVFDSRLMSSNHEVTGALRVY